MNTPRADAHPGRYWVPYGADRYECRLCPRYCRVKNGQRGFCYVRRGGPHGIELTTYGRSSGFCVDPIEKKPLNHFYPGTSVLSFGTAGCNLGCRFCQNWDISKSRTMDTLASDADPTAIARAARYSGCTSVAFTYNDPVIFAEYAIDTAQVCREQGVKNVVVSAGYITEEARSDFYQYMDAANIDLKGFSERFYKKLCFAQLAPVLDTLLFLRHETDVWLEVTTLLIPGENDSDEELHRLTEWMAEHLGPEVPLHFTAFHPDFKMTDVPPTAHEDLLRARTIALEKGLHHVYVGNVHDAACGSTYCAGCGTCVIERDWYRLGAYRLDADGACTACGTTLPGRFGADKGTWHGGRQLLRF